MRNLDTIAGLQPYYDIIHTALTLRSAESGDYETDKDHGVPVFVARMCQQLVVACVHRGQPSATMPQVLRLEMMASGHADYHIKLALYCRELEQHGHH